MLTTLSLLFGPLVAGSACFSLALALTAMATASPPGQSATLTREDRRRTRLRDASPIVRWLEPLVRDLAKPAFTGRVADRDRIAKSLVLSGESRLWRVDEFVGAAATAAAAIGLVVAAGFWWLFGGVVGVVLGVVVTPLVFYRQLRELHRRARERVAELRRSLPYATDLLSLMMEAGAEFTEALDTAAETMTGTVVGEEFNRMRKLIARGDSLESALDQFEEHADCDEVRELVRSIKNARKLGAPLSETMLLMAEQMRLKRVQRAEEQVGKAQVQITFPGILIMAACMIIVLTVFILPAADSGLFQ